MAAEGAEIKDEQIPPQEGGGDDEVREPSAQLQRKTCVPNLEDMLTQF